MGKGSHLGTSLKDIRPFYRNEDVKELHQDIRMNIIKSRLVQNSVAKDGGAADVDDLKRLGNQ